MTGDRTRSRAAAVEGATAGVFRLLAKLTVYSSFSIADTFGVGITFVGVMLAVQSGFTALTALAQMIYRDVISNRAAMVGSLGAMLGGTLIVAASGTVGGSLGAALFALGMALSGTAFTLNTVFRRRTAARFPDKEGTYHAQQYGWSLAAELLGGVAVLVVAASHGWPLAALVLAGGTAAIGLMAWRARRATPPPPRAMPADLKRIFAIPSVRMFAFAAIALYAFAQLSGVYYAPTLERTEIPWDIGVTLAIGEATVRFALFPITKKRGADADLSPRGVLRPAAAILFATTPLAIGAYAMPDAWWLTAVAVLGWMASVELGVVPATNSVHTGAGRAGERASQLSGLATSAGFVLGSAAPWLCEQAAPLFELLEAAFAERDLRPILLLPVLAIVVYVLPMMIREQDREFRLTVGRTFEIAWRDDGKRLEYQVHDGHDQLDEKGWAPWSWFEEAKGYRPTHRTKRRSERPVAYVLTRVHRHPPERRRRRWPSEGEIRAARLFRHKRRIVVRLGHGLVARLTVRELESLSYEVIRHPDGLVVLRIVRGTDDPVTFRFPRTLAASDNWEASVRGKLRKRSQLPAGSGRHRQRPSHGGLLRTLLVLACGVALGFGASEFAPPPELRGPALHVLGLAVAAATPLGAIAWAAARARTHTVLLLVVPACPALIAVLADAVTFAIAAAAWSLVTAWLVRDRRPPGVGA